MHRNLHTVFALMLTVTFVGANHDLDTGDVRDDKDDGNAIIYGSHLNRRRWKCTPSTWLPQTPANKSACLRMIVNNESCSHEFFNWKWHPNGNHKCGCVMPNTNCNILGVSRQKIKTFEISISMERNETITPVVPQLLRPRRRCGGGQFHRFYHYLDVYTSSPYECMEILLSRPECSHEFFDFNHSRHGGNNNCGCIAAGTQCENIIVSGKVGWYNRYSSIYKIVPGTRAPTAAPTVIPTTPVGVCQAEVMHEADPSLPPQFVDEERISSSENYPCFTQLLILPDGRMLVLGKTGIIYISTTDRQSSERLELEVYLQLEGVLDDDETGALSIVIDEEAWRHADDEKLLYVYWTREGSEELGLSDGGYISSFVHSENAGGVTSRAAFSSETIIWYDLDGVPDTSNKWHYGGQLSIGPDRRIYLSLGDKTLADRASDPHYNFGCIIRIELNGSIPEGNLPPLVKPSSCWAYGLRNGWGSSWVNISGTPTYIATNVGSNNWQGSINYEEINVVEGGDNLGWPYCEGFCNNTSPQFSSCDCSLHKDPVFVYEHRDPTYAGVNVLRGRFQYGASVIGGVVYEGSLFPSDYTGDYFFGDFIRGWIMRMKFNRDNQGNLNVQSAERFHSAAESITSFAVDTHGALWYGGCKNSRRGLLHSIKYHNSSHHRLVNVVADGDTQGAAPFTVQFSAGIVVGTNQGERSACDISIEWDYDDGSLNPANEYGGSSHTFTNSGVYYVYARSTARNGYSLASEAIRVVVGSPPVVEIVSPANNSEVRFGDIVELNSTIGTDASGVDVCWEVDIIHNEHVHPIVTEDCRRNATFVVESNDHGFGEMIGIRFTTRATDSYGLTTFASVDKWLSRPNCVVHPGARLRGTTFGGTQRARNAKTCALIQETMPQTSAFVFSSEDQFCQFYIGSFTLVTDPSDAVGDCTLPAAYLKHNVSAVLHPGDNESVSFIDTWGLTSNRMPDEVGEVASGLIDNELIVIGEGSDETMIFDVESPANHWRLGARRPYIGHHHLSLTVGQELFVIGGFDNGSPNTVQIYNPVQNSWRLGTSYPGLGKGSYSGAVLQESIYVCGGLYYDRANRAWSNSAFNFVASDCYRFDLSAGSWIRAPSMPTGVHHAASGTDGRRFYVFGGRVIRSNINGDGIKSLQIYDPDTSEWHSGADMPFGRSGMGSAPYYMYKFWIMGGEMGENYIHANDDGTYHHVITYSVLDDNYVVVQPIPVAAHGIWPVVDYQRNRIYVAGGGDTAGASKTSHLQILAADDDDLWNEASVSIANAPDGGFAVLPTINGQVHLDVAVIANEPQGAVVGNFLYQFGGFNRNYRAGVNFTLICDLTRPSRPCRYGPDIPSDTFGFDSGGPTHCANIVDGTDIYVVGGLIKVGYGFNNNQFISNETFRFDTVTEQWSVLPSLPKHRGGGGGGAVNGILHFFGGSSLDCRGDDVDYGPAYTTHTAFNNDCLDHWALNLSDLVAGWQRKANIPSPRNHLGSATFNGRIYSIGGQTRYNEGCDNRVEVEMYDPALDMWYSVQNLPYGIGHSAPATFATSTGITVVGGVRNNIQMGSTPARCSDQGVHIQGLHHYFVDNNTWDFVPMNMGYGPSRTSGVVNDTLFLLNKADLFVFDYPF